MRTCMYCLERTAEMIMFEDHHRRISGHTLEAPEMLRDCVAACHDSPGQDTIGSILLVTLSDAR